MKHLQKLWAFIVILSFISAFYFYPQMPDEVPIHWNSQGNADNYSSKEFGTFLMPVIILLMAVMFKYIPNLDPLRTNISKFKSSYEWFAVLLLLFFFVIQIVTSLLSLGYDININYVMFVMLGILFFGIGIFLEKAKRNWFMGIRTPWTMSSEKVWDKTNKACGILFKIYGILLIVALFFNITDILFVVIFPVIFIVVFSFIYSYLEYQKTK